MIALAVVVSGRVQGVGFRWSTRRRAEELGVSGWVRNLDDGRVEAHIEGTAEAVQDMLAWLRKGPVGAEVTHLEDCPATVEGDPGFVITV